MKVFYQPPGRAWQEMVEATANDERFTPEFVLSKFDGYVAPSGDFYGTRPTSYADYNEVNDCHEEFAYRFLFGIRSKYNTFKDELVLGNGWVSCTFAVCIGWQWLQVADIVQPNPTSDQMETIKLILIARNISSDKVTGMAIE